jgi:hypothetical protein
MVSGFGLIVFGVKSFGFKVCEIQFWVSRFRVYNLGFGV